MVMKLLLLSLFTLCTFTWALNKNGSGTSRKLEDYRVRHHNMSEPYLPPPPFQCTVSGLKCKNCREIIYCKDDGSGGFKEELQERCGHDQICDIDRCIKTPPARPPCSPLDHLKYICGDMPGTFPDPGDCKMYHMCIPSKTNPNAMEPVTFDCRNEGAGVGYGYNPKTMFCDKKLTNDACPGFPIPLCQNLGMSGPVTTNPSLYYVCMKHEDDSSYLYPYQNRCENGKKYSVLNHCK